MDRRAVTGLFIKAFSVLLVASLCAAEVEAQAFSKVSNAGELLPDSAPLGDGPNDWACTRDNQTGLMWETKRASGVRSLAHTYSWRSGGTGNTGNFSSCNDTLRPSRCNTAAYIARLNSDGLCGSTNWRLPGGSYTTGFSGNSPNGELAVLYRNAKATAGVNYADWFPGLVEFWHWTGVTDRFNFGRVWAVHFGDGRVFSNFWNFDYYVRAVTADQPTDPGPGPGPGPDPEPQPEMPPPPTLANTDPLFGHGFEDGFRDDFNDFAEVGDWSVINLSDPEGSSGWLIGRPVGFDAYDGPSYGYATVDYEATSATGTISAWFLSPELQFRPGSKVIFYTRAQAPATFADRLEVRACEGTECSTFTVDPFAVSGYTTPIVSINRDLLAVDDSTGIFGYPGEWTRFEFGADSGVPQSGTARIGFRYFVPDGGPTGANSLGIGIDRVRIDADPVEAR
jgi:hypothetical protein